MEKIALKVGGIVFVIMGLMHVLRLVKNVPIMVGDMAVPLWVSGVGALVALGLGVWMLKLAGWCCCCCKK